MRDRCQNYKQIMSRGKRQPRKNYEQIMSRWVPDKNPFRDPGDPFWAPPDPLERAGETSQKLLLSKEALKLI